ncbi:hypothetical protein BMS3Abin15_00109 [bacterium BMS3Abin15]|nr:hypothetical protein BMS3Abin15_00109 [bacterium BMS3Abin15]HDZ85184.1 hypothetical protein [Candidatus Moranbacteria bacterium]
MFLHFRILFYSLVFFVGLEMIAMKQGLIFPVVIILTVFSLWGAKKIGGRWLFSIIPVTFPFSSIAMLYLIDLTYGKQVFVFLGTLMYYLSLLGAYRLNNYSKDQTARGMILASAATTLFFFYTAAYGIYLNFLVPLWQLMIFFLLVTVFVSYQDLMITKRSSRKLVWSYSILLGMIMAEFAWVMNFWPFGYLTTGVIALIFYYVLWDLAQSYFLNLLSRKRVVANMILFTFLVSLVLVSSRWLPTI